jgi:hypothetical protein
MSSADDDATPPALVAGMDSSTIPAPPASTTTTALDELRERVHSIAGAIKHLKSSTPTDKDAISHSVKALLDAKRAYANANGGIDVDGKPWEEPMSNSERKKLEKEAKRKTALDAVDAAANQTSEGEWARDDGTERVYFFVFALNIDDLLHRDLNKIASRLITMR